jgi:tetraacyldisaccharide 4'-kinase
MLFLRYILFPFSFVYGTILWLRNKMFDWGLKSTEKISTAVISVGNLSVGGTGKSPHVEWITKKLKDEFHSAILSRGYGRKSRGFVKVSTTSKTETVGDEALYYKTIFQDQVEVAVCEKRVEGANSMIVNDPSIDVIVLDDAYQHRYIERDVNLLLTDYNHPFHKDFVMPTGRLREFRSGKERADAVIVTKCPDGLNAEKKEEFISKMKLRDAIPVFFSSIVYGSFISFGSSKSFGLPKDILLVTGVANPKPLEEHLSKIANVTAISFNDHHDFTLSDIERIHNLFDTFAEGEKCIVTTSKDYIRLKNSVHEKAIQKYPWFYQEITVDIDKGQELIEKIKLHVRKNK